MWHKYAEYVCIIQTKRSIKRFTNNSIFIEVLPRIPNYLETKLHIKPFSRIIQRNVKHDRKEKRNHEFSERRDAGTFISLYSSADLVFSFLLTFYVFSFLLLPHMGA